MKPAPRLIEQVARVDRGSDRRSTPLLPVPVFAFNEWNRRIRDWARA